MSRSTPLQPTPRAKKTAPPAAKDWHLDLTVWLGLVLAVLAVYAHVGHFSFFTFDDPIYVTENVHVRAGLTPENIGWAFTSVVDSNWIPVTLLSHMAVCEFFGVESGAHHWVNVLLHALAAGLLFAALKRATRARWPSAFVAFVFALHPLHVESVAWISERKDVLSAFFWFLALYAYILYTERPDTRRYLLVVAPFCLGLMAKPMLVTFPFTLLLLDVWPLRRAQYPRTLVEKVPLFTLSLISSVVAYLAQRSTGTVQSTAWGENLQNALVSYVGYIGQMFWPSGLAVFYPQRQSLPAGYAAGALILILGISALAVFTWRTRPYFATGWFWYLGTLVPVIGLVQIGVQSHADRYMYIPMVGLSVILAWGGAEMIRKRPQVKTAIATVAVVACGACFFIAAAQSEYWHDSESLYRRAISETGSNYVAEYNLGDYLMDIPGRASEAAQHFEAALHIRPDSADARNAIGGYLMQTGHDAEAAAQFEAALRTQPDNAEAHFNLGIIAEKSPERAGDATTQYEAAVRAKPQWARAHKSLGLLYLRLGRTTDALSQFAAAQRIQKDPEVDRIMERMVTGRR